MLFNQLGSQVHSIVDLPPLVEALPGCRSVPKLLYTMETYLWITPGEMPHVPLYFETTRSIARLCDIPTNSPRE